MNRQGNFKGGFNPLVISMLLLVAACTTSTIEDVETGEATYEEGFDRDD